MLFATLKCFAIRPVNRVTLVGAVHDIQTGFLERHSVFQFTLTCSLLDFQKASAVQVKSTAPKTASAVGEDVDKYVSKEQYAVRCLGSESYTDALKGFLEECCIVRVVGRLKTIEASDGGKKQRFPCIIVEQGRWSSVSLLHSSRNQKRDWQLQNLLLSTALVE
uniref:Uncharacterized protein n=1 Tax=Trypanosoma congolense (strain IL3000) TaxID=1068625 RepID=G0UR07_TRYCI|nr:conserved hypothetical protein [Trypanosoma congolense IL3000]